MYVSRMRMAYLIRSIQVGTPQWISSNLVTWTLILSAPFLNGCSIVAEILSLSKPQLVELGPVPTINSDNQNSVTLIGTCLPGVESFTITSPAPAKTVICNNGTWTVDLDFSSEPEGPIKIITDIEKPGGGNLEFEAIKDTVPPALTGLQLNSGVGLTNQSNISYQVSGDDVAQAYVTEDATCATGGSWKSAAATISLSVGDGSKTLYGKARDTAGNISGCILTASLTLDQTAPVITGLADDLVIKGNKSWTWSCTDLHGPCEYAHVVSQNSATSPGSVFDNTIIASQSSGDGLYYLAVQARDAAGNISAVTRVQVNLSSNLPTFTLSGGQAYSATNTVSVALTNFSYFDEIDLSNTASCAASTTQATAATLSWALSSGDGSRTVYYRFRNTTTSEVTGCYDASIIVDSTAPVVTGLSNDLTVRQSKTWTWSCTDVTPCNYRFVIDQTATTSPTGSYSATTTATQSTGDGVYYIHVQARDALGNESAVVHVQVTIDDSAPQILGLADDLIPKKSQTWTWSCSDSQTCQTRYVIDQVATTSPSGVYSAVTTASQTSGNGNYYLHIQALDSTGNESTVQHFRVVLDNTSPVLSGLADDAIAKTSKSFSWSCTDTYGPCTYRYVIDSTSNTTPTGAYGSTTTVTQATGTGTFYLHIQAQDVAGNETLEHISFVLDNSAPTVSLASVAPAVTQVSPIPVTVTFSESVSGFVAGDITLTNGVLSDFAGSGASYSFNVTPSGQGVCGAGRWCCC